MAWRCKDCGNTSEFYGIGAVSVTVYFDKDENVTEIVDPQITNVGASIEFCGACDGENIEDLEEDDAI